MDEVRRRVEIPQKAEPRHDRRDRVGLRQDIDELDFEEVARFGALDEHGAGERMDGARIYFREACGRARRSQLSVERVEGFEHDLFALARLQDGGNVRVPAVVPYLRLFAQTLAPVDFDALHRFSLDTQDGPRDGTDGRATARYVPNSITTISIGMLSIPGRGPWAARWDTRGLMTASSPEDS